MINLVSKFRKVRVFPFFGSVTLSRNHYKNILLALLCNIYWPLTSISSSVNLDKIALHLSAYSKSTASFSSSFCSLFSASLLVLESLSISFSTFLVNFSSIFFQLLRIAFHFDITSFSSGIIRSREPP